MANQRAAHGVHSVMFMLGHEQLCTDVGVWCKLYTIIGRFMIVFYDYSVKCYKRLS